MKLLHPGLLVLASLLFAMLAAYLVALPVGLVVTAGAFYWAARRLEARRVR